MEIGIIRQETGLTFHRRLTKKMRVFVQWKMRRRLIKEVKNEVVASPKVFWRSQGARLGE
jgi:hypothetical protein